MKQCLPALILLFIISSSMAQNAGTDAAFISAAYKPYNFDFLAEANIPKHPHVSLFKQIDVVDYRHDTTRIGFFNNAAHGKRQIIANPQTADGIATYLNKSYAHPLGNFSLLVVIRKFWLSDIAQERETAEQVELKPASSSIRFRAEAYVNDVSGYIPLGFLDTTITATRSLMAIAPFRLPLLFDALMNKLNAIDPDKVTKSKKRLSFQAIDSFSTRSFFYTINSALLLNKGVYASLQEFKNNKPTIHNYDISKDENGMMNLFLKDEQGKSYFSRKMWGYCDGEHLFVMMDGNLFPVLRDENAFYVYGSKEYIVKKTNAPLLIFIPAAIIVGSVPISEKVVRRLRLFTLDMETGAID